MNNYPYERKPAFFRVMSPELFFEAELDESLLENALPGQGAVTRADSELNAILDEIAKF
jgi:hypothetical protein